MKEADKKKVDSFGIRSWGRALWTPWPEERRTSASQSKWSLIYLLVTRSDKMEGVLLQAQHEKVGLFGKDRNSGKNKRQQEKRKTKFEWDWLYKKRSWAWVYGAERGWWGRDIVFVTHPFSPQESELTQQHATNTKNRQCKCILKSRPLCQVSRACASLRPIFHQNPRMASILLDIHLFIPVTIKQKLQIPKLSVSLPNAGDMEID